MITQLKSGEGEMGIANLSQFVILRGELYHCASQGWLARCIGKEDAAKRLSQIYNTNCGDNEALMYRRIGRQRYYLPMMKKDAAAMLCKCTC